MKKHLKWMLALLMLLVVSSLSAQHASNRDSVFQQRQDSLIRLRRAMLQADEQFVRFNLNEKLIDYWMETLRMEGAERFAFNAIDSMYLVQSPDRKLRIVTWHLLNDDFTYDYFGIAQTYSARHKTYVVFELKDKADRLPHPEYEMLRNGDWFGAIYFDIIQVQKSKNFLQDIFGTGRTYYTLLGWNGNDFKTDIKLIDVAYLQSNGDIVMGYPLFRTQDHRLRRIIFEYADRYPMTMNYDKQYQIIEEDNGRSRSRYRRQPPPPDVSNRSDDFRAQQGEKKPKEKQPKAEPKKMIIFERLIPRRPELEGIPSQTVPHPEDFAAFIFENGRWTYYNNVDALNPPDKSDNYERTYDSKSLFKQKQ
ncbi:MAG: hypothetical protein R6T91_06055 [Bacteroidales bacterium]